MRVRSVALRPFGRFGDESFDLAPGLTVVHGANEAGKSTLHQALLTAVGGVRRGGGRRAEVEELRHRYRPWSGDGWRVGAVVELADGTRVELTRKLDQSSGSRVTELGTGRDRAGEIIFEGAPDGWRWLGLDRTTYPATASVRQADVLRVGGSAGLLADQMQRAAAATGTDVTAARALERIAAYQREQVGAVSRHSTKPLRRAIVAEEEAGARLEEARRAHAGYLRLAAAAKQSEGEAERLARERRCAEAAGARHRAHDERRELERVADLQERHPGPPPERGAGDRLAQSAAVALRVWRASREPVPPAGATAAQLAERLKGLTEAPGGETAPAPEVRRAADAVAAATQSRRVHEERRPPPVPPPPTPVAVDRLQDLARALDPAPDAQTRASWAVRAWPVLMVAALILVAGIAGYAVARSSLWTVVALVVAVAVVAYAWAYGHRLPPDQALRRSRAQAAEAEAQGLGLPADPVRLRALAHEVAEGRESAALAGRWTEEQQAHLDAERDAREALHRELALRGATDLAGYEAACAARREQAARAALRGPLEQQLAARRELEAEAARAAEERRAALASLRAAASAVPGAPPPSDLTPEVAAARVEAWLREREARLEVEQRAESEWLELRTLLEAGSQEERECRAADAEREAHELARGLPEPELARALGQETSPARLRALAEQEAQARTRADHARGQLDQHPARRLGVPEAQEVLERARAERARLEALGQALDLARHHLEQAQDRVHRDLAPVLANTLRAWLPEVTSGRYRDANVDPSTLAVTVCGDDRDWRDASLLSRGTQEQVYLLLRLALVEHLTRPGESAPILFDEVTVHADETRTAALLSLLHRIAATHQVVVFTQEHAVRDWARQNLDPGRDQLVELAPP